MANDTAQFIVPKVLAATNLENSDEESHCGQIFLISPIGADDSKDREHANLVHTLLLEPAAGRIHSPACDLHRKQLEAITAREGVVLSRMCRGYKVERADHRPGSGIVMEKVADQIARADVVAAILTGIDSEIMNPNVMYELGIAHSAARTVVMLRRAGAQSELPFDVKHIEATPYSLDPDKNRKNEQVDLLFKAFSEALETERKTREEAATYAKPIFAWGVEGLDPLGVQYKNLTYYQQLEGGPPQIIPIKQQDLFQSVKQPDLVKMYKRARKRILLVDPHPEFYLPELKAYLADATKANQVSVIVDAARIGIRVDVMITDPNHSLLTEIMPGIGEGRVREHEESHRLWKDVASRTNAASLKASFEVHAISNSVLPQRVLATDREAVVIPRFYGVPLSGRGPCLQLSSTTKYFSEIFFDADQLIKSAKVSDGENRAVRPLSLKSISKLDIIEELNRTSRFAYWLNPPFTLENSRPRCSADENNTDPTSWDFINVVLGLSIRTDYQRNVVVLLHESALISGDGPAEDALRHRLTVSGSVWSRYVDAAQQHGGRINFKRVEVPSRLESILVTESSAIILPIHARLDLDTESRTSAVRLAGGSRQHALLLEELKILAGELSVASEQLAVAEKG